jgi:uncharacterized protein YcfJ
MPDEYLTTIEEGRRRVQRRRSADRVPTTEATGDPDEGSPEAAGQAGAATGALIGTVVAGPIGMAAGAAVGGAAGAAGAGDADRARTRDEEHKDAQLKQQEERR